MSASSSLSSVKESEFAEESRLERGPTAEEIREDANILALKHPGMLGEGTGEGTVRRGSKNKNKLPQLHRRDGDDVCDTEMEMATKRWKVAHFTRDVLEAFMLILLVFMVGFWIRVGMSWLKAIQ